MENNFIAVLSKGLRKDGSSYEYLSIGVNDPNGEYTELRRIFLTPLEKKTAKLCGVEFNDNN